MGLVVKAILRSRAELAPPNRPIASFMFLGPTGKSPPFEMPQCILIFQISSNDAAQVVPSGICACHCCSSRVLVSHVLTTVVQVVPSGICVCHCCSSCVLITAAQVVSSSVVSSSLLLKSCPQACVCHCCTNINGLWGLSFS